MTDEEVKELFNEADTNRDGKISFDGETFCYHEFNPSSRNPDLKNPLVIKLFKILYEWRKCWSPRCFTYLPLFTTKRHKLTLFQTTNFRLFQIETVCRRQFQI